MHLQSAAPWNKKPETVAPNMAEYVAVFLAFWSSDDVIGLNSQSGPAEIHNKSKIQRSDIAPVRLHHFPMKLHHFLKC